MVLYALGCIIVLAIMVIVITSRSMEDTTLKGFWRADARFCEEAELLMFVLYLGDNMSYMGNYRNGYLLAANTAGVILNNPIKINLSGSYHALPGFAFCKNYNAEIDWQDTPPDDPDTFPNEFLVSYYPSHGKLVLHNKDQVLAILWKDCQMSAMTSQESMMPENIAEKNQGVYDDL